MEGWLLIEFYGRKCLAPMPNDLGKGQEADNSVRSASVGISNYQETYSPSMVSMVCVVYSVFYHHV